MNRLKLSLGIAAIPFWAVFFANSAQAVLVYELIEQGSDVRVEQSGSLSGLIDGGGASSSFCDQIRPNGAEISFDGCSFVGRLYTISGPANFGSGLTKPFSVTVAPSIRTLLKGSSSALYIEGSYVEGTPITASGLITGESLATLGLNTTSGLLGTWSTGSDSIEVWAGAKPASAPVPAPLPLMGAGTAFAFSRRLRARLHRARRSQSA